eukprot:Selendium_serpulae@DN5581_c2_g1_i7.p1
MPASFASLTGTEEIIVQKGTPNRTNNSVVVRVTGAGVQFFTAPTCNTCGTLMFVFTEASVIYVRVPPTDNHVFPLFAPVATNVEFYWPPTQNDNSLLGSSAIVTGVGCSLTLFLNRDLGLIPSATIWALPTGENANVVYFCTCACDAADLDTEMVDLDCEVP